MKTLRDVALHAGVSSTTVSLVLNGRQPSGGSIPTETRRRVLESASELGYRRNALLKAIVSGQNRMLGFLARGVEHEFFGRILGGALDEADAHNYTLKVLRLKDNEVDRRAIERCLELRLAGILTVDIGEESLEYLHREMKERNVPLAFANSDFEHPWGTRIISDDMQGCRLAIEHLIQLGHKRIAFVSGRPGSGMAALREAGFRTAMREHDLDVSNDSVCYGDWNLDTSQRVATELLALSRRPTAIFCANDSTAIGVQRAARQAGFEMPRDLSVVGFADLSFAALATPALTTVAQPFEEMGRVAVRRLLEKIAQTQAENQKPDDEPVNELLPTRLVIRESTAIPV